MARIICRDIIIAVALMVVAMPAMAQSRKGADEPRTRMIPYPTEQAASEQGIGKQRYMQPIEEWRAEGNVLYGEYTYPFSWLERQVFVRVEGVKQPYELYINGKRAGGSTNGYVAAEYNITKLSKEDKNSIELRLGDGDKMSRIECFDDGEACPVAYVISQPRVRVRDVAWRANIGVGGVVNADFSVVMQNETLGQKSSRLYYELFINDTLRLTGGYRDVQLGMYGVDTMRFGAAIPDSVLWRGGAPRSVILRLKNRIAGRDVEFYHFDVPLRQLEFSDGKFYVNNAEEPIEWRDMSPNVSIEELASAHADGLRAVRFTAGFVDDALLDYCGRVGIYVAVTAPINSSLSGQSRKRGGNPSNMPSWREEYVARTVNMIHSTKRHSCVVAYFLADDSANGICLYESYLAAKRVAGDRPVFYFDGGSEWNSDYHPEKQ